MQLEEFDEQQKTTQADEMCMDLKLIVNTVTKMKQSMQAFQKKLLRSDGEVNAMHAKED